MDANNVAVIRGTVSSEPVVRTLPSGSTATHIEVTTRLVDGATSVPVAVHAARVDVVRGDEVVVVGHVSRRFFRAGGVTQSRTELIAERLVKASRKVTVARAVDRAVRALDPT